MVLIINNNKENDYELLYLIENDSEEALEVMFEKYNNLIVSLISKYHFDKMIEEDIYQEARMVLFKAINTFDNRFGKTFTMYFKKLLENRFNTLIKTNKKEQHYEVYNEEQMFVEEEISFQIIDDKKLSLTEKQVYFEYFYGGNSIEEVSKKLNLTKKQTYNAVCRIKKKLKN